LCEGRRASDKVVLRVRRSLHGNSRCPRLQTTGSSNAIIGNSDSRPAPVTSSGHFRFAERPADARTRRGVLSQLPPVSEMTSWERELRHGMAARRRSARSNLVTTDYGWIDADDEAAAGDCGHDDSGSDKVN